MTTHALKESLQQLAHDSTEGPTFTFTHFLHSVYLQLQMTTLVVGIQLHLQPVAQQLKSPFQYMTMSALMGKVTRHSLVT